MLLFFFVPGTRAELPPPDYRAAVVSAAADEVARRAKERGMDAATLFAAQWERQVGPSAEVSYDLGLAWRLSGDARKARVALDRALELDPLLVAARYDRGEVELAAGDLAAAEADFREVVRLEPRAWPGHFRLADIAGLRGDAAGFEAHLVDALRCGFTVRSAAADPHWRGFLQDPALGPVLRRLVTVYQDESILQQMEAP